MLVPQVVVVVVWQVVSPARAIHHFPAREDNMLVCDSYVDASYTIAFFYPVLLILVCTVYAVLTRKIPEAFNESKHIGTFLLLIIMCILNLSDDHDRPNEILTYLRTRREIPLYI